MARWTFWWNDGSEDTVCVVWSQERMDLCSPVENTVVWRGAILACKIERNRIDNSFVAINMNPTRWKAIQCSHCSWQIMKNLPCHKGKLKIPSGGAPSSFDPLIFKLKRTWGKIQYHFYDDFWGWNFCGLKLQFSKRQITILIFWRAKQIDEGPTKFLVHIVPIVEAWLPQHN